MSESGPAARCRPPALAALRVAQLPLASAISAVLAGGVPIAQAQAPQPLQPRTPSQEVTVTAQKVTENLQNVPVSIETLNTQKLEQLNISNLDDYVQNLPGLTTIKSHRPGGNGVRAPHASTCAASTAARRQPFRLRSPPSARTSTSSR